MLLQVISIKIYCHQCERTLSKAHAYKYLLIMQALNAKAKVTFEMSVFLYELHVVGTIANWHFALNKLF